MEELSASPSPSAAAEVGGGGASRWTPHGRLLTACLVALNVFVVLLVYFYFWRFLSSARAGAGGRDGDGDDGDGDGDGASSSGVSSPLASPKARDARDAAQRAITALPVFVHSPSGGAAAECAICIAEFADGEEGRLLPRCGHRFHARCVDTWFRSHATCPLCRATAFPAAAAADAAAPTEHQDQPSEEDSPV